jgi:hypothetical protein
MKKIIIIGLIIFASSNLFAQISKDSTVLNFIKSKHKYIALTDSSNLSDTIKLFYNNILDYLSTSANDYYVDTSNIKIDSLYVNIPIYHYDGFKKGKELQDRADSINKDKKVGDQMFYITLGNASGKDGFLVIDKRTRKILRISAWQ